MENTASDKQKRIKEAALAVSAMSPGTLLTHLTLGQQLGEPPRTRGYYGMVGRLKKVIMQDWGLFLATSHRIGYVIALPGSEIDVQDNKCAQATNRYVKAVKEMQYIDIDKITDDPLKQRTVRIAQDRANVVGLLRLGAGLGLKEKTAGGEGL